jgi:tRNA threonylcarbamoyladenosine biosynthesis protein TsaE
MEKQINISSSEQMIQFGQNLSKQLKGGDIIYLNGDLGAGKTTLTKGIIKGLGYDGNIKSPTFTLVESYSPSEVDIHHFDLYRIADPEELEWMGIRDYFNENSIVLIEWPEKGEGFLPEANIEINISYLEEGRHIEIFHN